MSPQIVVAKRGDPATLLATGHADQRDASVLIALALHDTPVRKGHRAGSASLVILVVQHTGAAVLGCHEAERVVLESDCVGRDPDRLSGFGRRTVDRSEQPLLRVSVVIMRMLRLAADQAPHCVMHEYFAARHRFRRRRNLLQPACHRVTQGARHAVRIDDRHQAIGRAPFEFLRGAVAARSPDSPAMRIVFVRRDAPFLVHELHHAAIRVAVPKSGIAVGPRDLDQLSRGIPDSTLLSAAGQRHDKRAPEQVILDLRYRADRIDDFDDPPFGVAAIRRRLVGRGAQTDHLPSAVPLDRDRRASVRYITVRLSALVLRIRNLRRAMRRGLMMDCAQPVVVPPYPEPAVALAHGHGFACRECVDRRAFAAERIGFPRDAAEIIERDADLPIAGQVQLRWPSGAVVDKRITASRKIRMARDVSLPVEFPLRGVAERIDYLAATLIGIIVEAIARATARAALDHPRRAPTHLPLVLRCLTERTDLSHDTAVFVHETAHHVSNTIANLREPAVVVVTVMHEPSCRPAIDAFDAGQPVAVAAVVHLQFVPACAAHTLQAARIVPNAADPLLVKILDIFQPGNAGFVEFAEYAVMRREIGDDHSTVGKMRNMQLLGRHDDLRAAVRHGKRQDAALIVDIGEPILLAPQGGFPCGAPSRAEQTRVLQCA
ncbi:hypothetical protein X979_6122 [Burkholderia pseudomallei MSHR7527]|nr:hypothetical protein X979_6122 [Burkholderia pseudomallei MSHR7527]